MKKLLSMLMLSLVLVLVACGNDDEPKKEKQEDVEKPAEKENEGSIGVEKNLLSVEVTIPDSMFDGENVDQVIADAKADGVGDVIQNSDGSLTYKMSKSKHKEMIKEMGDSLKSSVEEMVNDEDYTSIKDITFNKTFSEFTMVVDKEVFENSFDGFAVFGLGIGGMMYQLFDGAEPDANIVTINVKDATSGEVFDTIVYPDDIGE